MLYNESRSLGSSVLVYIAYYVNDISYSSKHSNKKKYYEFITNLPIFLPNSDVGNHFAKLLDEYPVEPYLSSRMSFIKWIHFIHNKINVSLGKPDIPFYDFLEWYHKQYLPKDICDKEKKLLNKRYIEIAVIVILILLVCYCWKK